MIFKRKYRVLVNGRGFMEIQYQTWYGVWKRHSGFEVTDLVSSTMFTIMNARMLKKWERIK